ncbi:MAG: hypothetical protein ACOY93_20520 [Bacillota bacterium]
MRAALLALLLGLLALLPAAGAVRAEEAKPVLELLEVGWDGHITAGSLAPVRVRLTGAARDLDAMVEVTLENQYQTGPNETVRIPLAAYAQEVSLPAAASKEVSVWVPTSHGLWATVRLKVGEEELAREQIEFRATKAPYWPLVGILSAEEQLAATARRIALPLQGLPQEIHVARLKAEALPDRADRMRALRAMLVQGNSPSALSDDQRLAIYQWVENGGHLLLAGGPDSGLTAAVLPAGKLPVTFGGALMDVDLSPLVRWSGVEEQAALRGPAVKMEPRGGTLLAGTPEQPLAWRMAVGKGTITVLAVDLTLEPLASWSGSVPLLKQAISPALFDELTPEEEKFRIINMEQDMSYRLRTSIEALPTDAYPGWQQVALYLGGFALLAGPGLHLLFWRNRRRGWVWLAVPLASLLVAGAIYLGGVAVGGRDMLGHTVSYVRLDTTTGTAGQMMMVGVYAPMRKELILPVATDAPINVLGLVDGPNFGPWGPRAGSETKPSFRLVTGRETRMEFYTGEWAMRPLSLSRTLSTQQTGQITTHLKLEGNLIRGTVTNETPYHLEDAAVAVGGVAARLGELAPGATAEVTLQPEVGPAQPFRHVHLPTLFFGRPIQTDEGRKASPGAAVPTRMPAPPMVYQGGVAQVPMEVPREPEIQRRSRMLESMLYRPTPGPGSTSLPLTFIAFTRDAVGPAVVDLEGHPEHHLHLIQQDLYLEVEEGPFTLPASLIPSEIAVNTMRGMGSSSNGVITWMEIDGGSVTFTFTPPVLKGTTITALEVNTQMVGEPITSSEAMRKAPPPNFTPQAAAPGIFRIFNFRDGAWEELPAGQERVRLTDPADYLGASGEVKLQAVSGSNQIIRFVVPQLTLEGRGGR